MKNSCFLFLLLLSSAHLSASTENSTNEAKPYELYISRYNLNIDGNERTLYAGGSGVWTVSANLDGSGDGPGSGNYSSSYSSGSYNYSENAFWAWGPDLLGNLTDIQTSSGTNSWEIGTWGLAEQSVNLNLSANTPGSFSTLDINAQTTMTLGTGGAGMSHVRNLFEFYCGASECTASPWASVAGPGVFAFSDGYTYIEYFNTFVSNIPPQSIKIGTLGSLNANSSLFVTLPDNRSIDVTPSVAGANDYEFDISAQKFDSYFQVFVRQPYPQYPNDLSDYLVGEIPSPPLGYPIYQPGGKEAGHVWWTLTNDAPSTILSQLMPDGDLQWLDRNIGYAPVTNYFVSYVPPIKQGPGEIDTNNGTEYDVYRVYRIGFSGPGLIDGLGYIESISNAPGIWNSETNNCVHQTVNTANACGLHLTPAALPPDYWTPEFFGFSLPQSDQ